MALAIAIGSVLIAVFVAIDLVDLTVNWTTIHGQFGVDYHLYVETAARWLNGGAYFQLYQVTGPYPISAGDILYPPIALILFIPFTILPALLWWLIPGAALAWCLFRLRPTRAAWLWIAVCAAWPTTPLKILTGNPVIWTMAAMALGVCYAWPSVLVLIKPSLFPFALFGAHRRRWWVALAALALISVPFGALWVDWIHSLLNSQGGGIAYSALEIPLLALPIVAWMGRTRLASAA